MGHIVTVIKEYKRKTVYPSDSSYQYERYDRKWEAVNLQEPRAGWVIGTRVLMNGRYVPGSGGYDGDYDPPYLDVKDTVCCLLVSYWPTMNPVRVSLDGWEMGGIPLPPTYSWTERDKEEMRKIMKDVKRDERGRWLK
uniref:Uncharacterized protein n=1 Tax=viral metagenome TaxID=1070528 RepID=A0A6M3IL15_9ZZZZ